MVGRKVNQKQRNRRRYQILKAAQTLFSSKGFHGTTMAEIVHRAQTSIGNCYFYFPNKDAILHALVEQLTADIRDEADRSVVHLDDPAEILAVSIKILVERLWEHREIATHIFSGISPNPLRISTMSYYRAGLKRFFKDHPDLIGDTDMSLAAIAFQGSMAMIFEQALDQELSRNIETIWAFLIKWNFTALGVPLPHIQQIIDRNRGTTSKD